MSYRYMHAGYLHPYRGGLSMYVRHRVTGLNDLEVRLIEPGRELLRAPDREILVVDNQHTQPMQQEYGDWDYCIPLSPGNRVYNDVYEVNALMVNAVVGMTTNDPEYFTPGRPRLDKTEFYADSGGFQILRGLLESVDPLALGAWYRNNTDFGFSLDVPASKHNKLDDPLYLRRAKIQRENDREILQEINPSKFITIIHGDELNGYLKFHDIVAQPGVKRIATPVYRDTPFKAAMRIYSVINALIDEYEGMHLLGLYNPALLMPFMRLLAKRWPDKLFTSDSSSVTFRTAARGGFYRPDITFGLNALMMSRSQTDHIPFDLTTRLLPCSCMVCSEVKYTDFFSHPKAMMAGRLLYHHNILAVSSQLNETYRLARWLDDKQWRQHIMYQAPPHASKWIGDFIDFIDALIQDDMPKARSYSVYLSDGLFDAPGEDELPIPDSRLLAVMDFYENHRRFDKPVVHARKKKDAPKDDRPPKLGGYAEVNYSRVGARKMGPVGSRNIFFEE